MINPFNTGQATPKNLTVSQGLHLHMLQSSYTHYFQQSKQKKQLAFKKPQAVAARCVFGPWCGAVITTFRSQPNIETTEEQMFAFPRRAIFQETRGRSTKYWQSMGIRNQSSKGLCPCWNWNSAPSPARSAWSIGGMVGNNPVWGLQAEGCWQEKTTRRRWLKSCWDSCFNKAARRERLWVSSNKSPGAFPYVSKGFEDPWAKLLSC